MGLSLKEYEQMKAAGLVKWDENAPNNTEKNINSYLDGVRRQSMFEGQKWGREEFQRQRGQLDTLRVQLRYLQSYAENIKDSDTERYAALTERAKTLGEGLDSAESWFKDNGDSFLRHKQWQAVGEQKRVAETTNMVGEIDAAERRIDTIMQSGKEKTPWGTDKTSPKGFDLAAKSYERERIAQKYGISVDELNRKYHDFKTAERQQAIKDRYEDKTFDSLVRILSNDQSGIGNDGQPTSNRLPEEDKAYIYDRIVELGNAYQLNRLRENAGDSYYRGLRNRITDQVIEEKNEQRYYLNAVKKDPAIKEILEKARIADLHADVDNRTIDLQGGDVFAAMDYKKKVGEKQQYLEQLSEKGYDAETLLKYYKRYTEHQQAIEKNKQLEQTARKHPVFSTINSIPLNMIGSLGDTLKYGLAELEKLNGGDGYVDTDTTRNKQAETIRSTVTKMMDEKIDNDTASQLAQFLYGTATSLGDMALAAVINEIPFVGAGASSAMFFSSAGISAANEVMENGGTLEQATGTLLTHGAAELIFEKISLEKLKALKGKGNLSKLRDAVTNTVKQSLTEGSEEMATSIANTLTDWLINGDLNEIERSIQAYREDGLSEEEAKRRAQKDFIASLGADTLGGALSGGILGGAVSGTNYISGKKSTGIGSLNVTRAQLADLTEENRGSKTGAATKTAREIVKDKGAAAVLEAAAQSENAQTRKTAAHFAELNKQGKLDERDAAQLLVKLAKEQEVIHGIDALAASEGKETLTDFRQQKSRVAEYNSGFDLSGRRAEDGGTLKTNAANQAQETVKGSSFGAVHPNGVAAHTADGKAIVVRGIESSLPEYGGDRGVTLQLADGSLTDAAEVTLDSGDYQRLLNLAVNYDTLGARALLYHYASAEQNGMSLDDYTQAFHAVYENGRRGLDYAHAMQNPTFEALSRDMGAEAFRGALEAGNNDGTIDAQARNHFEKRVRVKGISLGKSRVRMEPDVDVTLSDDGKAVLQAVAEKSGKEIVLTNALSSEDRGAYRDNKLYLRADLEEHVMVITALHEAVHNMKVYAPQDFRVLQQFVVNYLVSQGKSIETELASLSVIYGKDAPTDDALTEELICKTVESLAADTEALNTALSVKENQPLKEKIAAILKRIADAVAKFFRGDKEMKLSAHNRYAQTFLDDVKALRDMAELVSKGFDTARENEREFGERKSENRHSYAGADAKTADHSLLQQAQEMERQGKASEQIRQETGWHKGYDGKWRFEIDDSGMEINERIFTGGTLEDLIKHDALVEAYPQLKKLRYEFERLSGGTRGYTMADGSGIVLDKTLRTDALNGDTAQLKKTLIHEIQHVIQHMEGFSKGTNPTHYAAKYPISKMEKESKERIREIIGTLDSETANQYYRFKDLDWAIDNILENGGFDLSSSQLEQLEKFTDEHDELYTEFYGNDWFSEIAKLERRLKNPAEFYRNLYYNTAGEIEARDTADRLSMREEERKEKRPDIDRDDVVFADGGVSYEIKYPDYSEDEINNNVIILAETQSVYTVPSKRLEKTGKRPSDLFDEFFNSIGNNIYSDEFGDIEINHASTKSEIRHGITSEKIASIEAIPSVIAAGKVIYYKKAYKENLDRIVISAPIKIGEIPYYMGVMLQRDNNTQRLYLHNVAIEKDTASISKADLLTTSAPENDRIFITTILQNALAVKYGKKLSDSGKFSKDDTIIDPDELDEELLFTSDGDLSFDGYGTSAGKAINVEQLMQEQGAEQAIYTLYNAAARTAERGIKGYNGVRLERKNFERVARGVMKQYSIAEKQNPEMVTVIADRLEEYVNAVKRGKKADFDTFLNALATDCKRWLERSGDYSRGSYEEDAKKLYGILRGKTIILSSYDESAVLDEYGGDIRKLRSQLRGYVNVGFAEDKHKYKNPIQIQDVIDGFASETGDGYEGISPYFPGGESMDGAEAWDWLVKTLELFKQQFVSRYGNDFYYESMDAAAVDMALWLNSAIVDEKAQHAATIKKADRQTIRQLADDRHKALAEQKALHRAKQRQSEQQLDRMRQRYQRERGLRESAEEENDIMKRMAANDARDYRKQYNERQQKAALIRRLGAKLGSLTKRLDGKANKNAYIPESLKQPLLHVLQLFEVAPGNDREIPGYFGTFKQLNEVSARIGSLADVYEKLEGKTDFGKGDNLSIDINGLAYDKAVLRNLRDVAGMVSGKNVYQMTADDLKMVYEALNDLDHQLKESVQIIVDGQKAMIQEFAEEGIKQTGEVWFSKDGRRWVTDTLRTARNKFVATSLDPVRYARMLSGYHDDGILYKAVLDLHRGDQKRTRIMQRAYTPVQAVIEGYQRAELVKLQRKAVEEFTMKDRSTGADVKLSQGMLLSIYLTNRQADGHRHLCAEKYGQYTRVPDLDYLNKNRVLPDLKGNQKRAHGDKSHKIVLTRDMLQRIDEYVERTPLLKDLAEAIHDVFNGTLADEINAVSMQRYGKLIATVKDYYPLKTDSKDPNKQYEASFDGENIFSDERLKTRGFTKQRVKSWTAVVIDDALDVFQRHVNETTVYCGLMIPVENIKKLINSGNDDILLREAIENKFGGDAIHYLNKLLGDIQKRRDDDVESMLTRASGKAMGAALFMNVRSALKNWGAMPLANRYFGTGNVAKAAVVGFAEGRKLVEKYNDYTSYMWYRAEGNGTVVGEVSRKQKLYGRITDKFDIMSWADQKVVNSLLYAAEQHVKQTTDLVYDSEEFKKEVARQFEKCIDESQPNSMLTSKPQFVRNVGMRVLSLNAFASQRMAMGNCFMDSFMEYDARRHEYQANKNAETKQAKKEAKKRFLKTALGVFESASLQFLLGALASMLVYHKWDDYKDKEGNVTPGGFFSGIGWNALKGIPEELAGSFAWADKLYSAAEKLIDKDAYGPDFDVMSLSAALEVYDAVQKRNFPKAWGKFADMTGLYAFGGSTEQRLVQSVRSYGTDIWGGRLGFTDNKGAIDLNYMDVQIAEAISAGDVKQAEWLRALWESELEKKGESAGGIDAKIEKALAAGNDDIYNAAIARENGDIKTHKALTEKLIRLGVEEATVDKAVKQVISGLKQELKDGGFDTADSDTAAAELMTKGLNEAAAAKIAAEILSAQQKKGRNGIKYTYTDAFNALKNGERDSYNDMVQYLAQAYLDKGKAESMEKAEEHVEKELRKKERTDKLFKERDDATDHDKRDAVRRVNRELLNIFGSEDAVKKAYAAYKKKSG